MASLAPFLANFYPLFAVVALSFIAFSTVIIGLQVRRGLVLNLTLGQCISWTIEPPICRVVLSFCLQICYSAVDVSVMYFEG